MTNKVPNQPAEVLDFFNEKTSLSLAHVVEKSILSHIAINTDLDKEMEDERENEEDVSSMEQALEELVP